MQDTAIPIRTGPSTLPQMPSQRLLEHLPGAARGGLTSHRTRWDVSRHPASLQALLQEEFDIALMLTAGPRQCWLRSPLLQPRLSSNSWAGSGLCWCWDAQGCSWVCFPGELPLCAGQRTRCLGSQARHGWDADVTGQCPEPLQEGM